MLPGMSKHRRPGHPVGGVLTVREVAALLRISRRTAAVAVLAGDLPRRRQGLRLVVPTRDLLASFGVPLDYTEEHSDHDR